MDEDRRPVPENRPWGRGAKGLVSLGTACLGVLLTWHATSLSGLPDVGDPFDVDAFCRPVPDESNAFVLYRQATGQLRGGPEVPSGDWRTSDDAARKRLTDNREALETWRRGTERPESLYVSPRTATYQTAMPVVQSQRNLARLALLEGTRREAEGDLDGALDWYLAVLRASRHTSSRTGAIGRLVGIAIHGVACQRLSTWARDPRVGAASLRRALGSVIAIDAMTPAYSEMIKFEYLVFVNTMADPDHDLFEVVSPAPRGARAVAGRAYRSLLRVLGKEPERSLRVVRLVTANWLSGCDLPASRRPPMAKLPPGGPATPRPYSAELYEPTADAPAAARALPPAEIDRWLQTTMYAGECLPAYAAVSKAVARERAAHASLVLALANELYRREHGRFPDRVEELVGPDLPALPEGYGTPK